jgi:hypothetical protein
MVEHDDSLCVICSRPLSARDSVAYGSRCEDCWCAGGNGEYDSRLAGGPHPPPAKETRGRPTHSQGAARCYSSSLTTDDLKSITNQGRRSKR